MPVKNPDGTEAHKTMKLRCVSQARSPRLPLSYTKSCTAQDPARRDAPHVRRRPLPSARVARLSSLFARSATNYGMAFTKDGSPGDTKFAMIDRSIAHLVRSIGKNAQTDAEFQAHMAKPEQQKRLMRFRLMVSLVGAVKLAIKGVPAFQPNLAYANRVWDYLDKQVLVGEYNLPNRQPRKCLKREEARRPEPGCLACCTCTHEHVIDRGPCVHSDVCFCVFKNLRTMTVLSAVCNVFVYKQARTVQL